MKHRQQRLLTFQCRERLNLVDGPAKNEVSRQKLAEGVVKELERRGVTSLGLRLVDEEEASKQQVGLAHRSSFGHRDILHHVEEPEVGFQLFGQNMNLAAVVGQGL